MRYPKQFRQDHSRLPITGVIGLQSRKNQVGVFAPDGIGYSAGDRERREFVCVVRHHVYSPVGPARQGVLELVMDIVDREREIATQATQAARDRDVDLLERRIAKLKANLQATELRFAEGARQIEQGISSIYREVQGLDHADKLFERKRELMTTIFQANLKLQKDLFLKQKAV